MPKQTLARRVDELERKLSELWRHEGHLSGMVIKLSRAAGFDTSGSALEDMPQRKAILDAIRFERDFQDKKWGPLERQNGRDMFAWIDALREEVDESSDAHFQGRKEDAVVEMVQVAAVAIACLEQLAPDNIVDLVMADREKG